MILLNLRKRIKAAGSYQDKRNNHDNWLMIEQHLGENYSVLDVACDSGFYSLKAAENGRFVVGFDILPASLKKAVSTAQSHGVKNACFMEMALSPSNVLPLPRFDAVFCLSVYHHFFRHYGEENAKQMVLDLFEISRKQLFFQIPSKIGKYGEGFSIDFKGDKDLVDQYTRELFAGTDNCVVNYVGQKEEKPPTEEYRYLYLIEKTQ